MQVIGAGFMRTGTMSLQAALQTLGYRCYHMQEVSRRPDHVAAWQAYIDGSAAMDWRSLFGDYSATVDAPAFWYWAELLREFPDAKIVLTVRDAEKWHASFMTLRQTLNFGAWALGLVPGVRGVVKLANTIFDKVFGGDLGRDNCLRVFHEHNDKLQGLLPPERLLVFDVAEGWAPLCRFLDCPIPDGVPFPHLNGGAATLRRQARRIFIYPWLMRLGCVLAVAGTLATAYISLPL